MEKLHDFNSFSRVRRNQQTAKLEEEKEARRTSSAQNFKNLLSEYGVSEISELNDNDKASFFERLKENSSSDDVSYMIDRLEEAYITEGNAFSAARAKAIANGDSEFTVDGETYPVEDVDSEDKENAEEFAGESKEVNEGISVFDERHFGKNGIIIMIDDNGKKVSAIFKDKKNADKFNRNKPSDIKKLLDLAKKTKYPKAIDESVNEGRDVGHYERIGNQTIVDSNFVNYSKGILPNSKLVHLGMGDFALKTPNGDITFARSGKIDGAGQDFVGRPHRVTDKSNGKLVDELIKAMVKKKKAVLSMSESVEFNEGRFYAFYKGQKHEIEADSLWKAKQKAITDLKVKKKDVGILAVVNADQHDDFSSGKNADFAFENEVNEADIKSADEFKEYAFDTLKKAFGDDFDEDKAQETVDGILSKAKEDYGVAVGMLQSSLG